MSHSSNRPSIIAAVALAAAFVLPLSQKAEAYACKTGYLNAPGQAKLKGVAKAKAKAKWIASVKQQHGLSWSVWNIAKNKTFQCQKAGSKQKCWAIAIPCQYTPSS